MADIFRTHDVNEATKLLERDGRCVMEGVGGARRPHWNWYLTVKPEILERTSPLMREVPGFGTNVTSSLESLYLKR